MPRYQIVQFAFSNGRRVRREPRAREGGTTLRQTGVMWDEWGGGRGPDPVLTKK